MTSTTIATRLKVFALCALAVAAGSSAAADNRSEDGRLLKAASAKKGTREGLASYYGKGFHGKKTADGRVFDKNEMVAAHPSYPMGTQVRVTNLRNGKALTVRIVDRGPAPARVREGVIIDLSERAAAALGFRHQGKTRVKTEVLE